MVEVMVVVVLFVFIASGIYAIAAIGQNCWEVNNARIELQQELRKAQDWMINDLRQAGDSSITNVPADGNWYTNITFKTPAGVSAGSLQWNTDSIQFIRGGTGSKQLHRITGGTTKILAQNMQALQFRRESTSSHILEIAMQAQKPTEHGRTVNYVLSFAIQLRN